MAVKKRSKVSAEFNMSSLTDIIFLLLIFFMLTSSIVTPNALDLQLPGKKTSPPPPKSKNKVVAIDESGAYTLNGAPISLDGVERQMEALKRIDGTKAAIAIAPSGKASNETVVAVLDLAYKMQVRAVLVEPR
ncbi:MAG: biopolymer transporter ExbD [Saprospiraceae bacterium]|jgi:biopolymer transport protein ExbD|nr:biopolymer transporter ExbD [Saprospiraceae bacterium]MBK6666069.1 biopolymer transporter ExbD [Saprospiraceae bacterium]MBK7699694.1 biopolymer transporter ExbD [Saprospiraceae bacterium]MBK8828032.1 biopolymer transporter ExbD [Saprospiraceae bacterium]MBK8886352.1 biopolymer transporter ExbD [Saprospiraceae bacterium]